MKPTAFRGSNLTEHARKHVCRWLTANSLDPHLIPLDSLIVVTGNRIHYRETIRDQRRRGGKKTRIRMGDRQWSVVTRPRTARIRYDLEDA